MNMGPNMVKENPSWKGREPLALGWLLFGAVLTLAAFGYVTHIDRTLPSPRPPPPQSPATTFSGLLAHDHLVNLTSIGPRVAGSYENEVLAVGAVVQAVKEIAAKASIHNHVEIDLHRASGAFPLTFFDGMNNIYRDVQSVVVRVRGAGGAATRFKRSALLLNCHFDTVPDSPGASDDGAGCAVLFEVLRALSATPHPLKHDAIFLFNGAEENIMQASHAFVTTHKWAKSVRAFINIEACGAGGREVLFQAGPHDPWIMEVYAGAVPHPFASSLAQELFEGGLIPADTDFRIFRDFGKLSGVDLAWGSNGYVYHTYLDAAERVPPETLQRTGDNVLALAHGMLASDSLESDLDVSSRQPVFFDVLGIWLVTARAPLAALVAAATLALDAATLHADACYASKRLYVSKGAWWGAVGRALWAVGVAHVAGLAAAAGVGAALHLVGARLAFFSRPWLLAPLYALPALGVAWYTLRSWVSHATCGAVPIRGWWAARLVSDAVVLGWAAILLLCVSRGLRSGFVPLQWALLLALATRAAQQSRTDGGGRLAWWSAGSLLPLLQTWYLALGCLQMFIPIMGRAGTPPLPPDVLLGSLTGALALAAWSWLLPGVASARGVARVAVLALITAAIIATLVAVLPTGSPYSPVHPQRYMVFHTRCSIHGEDGVQNLDHYWLPNLDANTPQSLRDHVPEIASAKWEEQNCSVWPYCGAPYFLPVIQLISSGYSAPAASPPDVQVNVSASTEKLGPTTQALHINITGPTHIVVIISPIEGAKAIWCSALDAPPLESVTWNRRHTYFLTLHDARAHSEGGGKWKLTVHLQHNLSIPPKHWAALSIAGHAMADKRAKVHEDLFKRFPKWTAPTGWGVHMHLLNV